MKTDQILTKPFSDQDNVPHYMELVSADISSENWEKAQTDLETLERAWRTVSNRIQYAASRTETNGINVNLARLKSYILSKDQSSAAAELSEVRMHWNDLGK